MLSVKPLIILAAGCGSRLGPLTDDRPKCLVPILGRTLLDRQVEAARQAGVNNIVVVSGYRADKLESYGLPTVFAQDYADTNMLHSLFTARDYFADGFVMAYGDIVYRPSIMRAIMNSPAAISVAIDRSWRDYWSQRFDDPLSDAETLRLGWDGMIREIGAKPKSYDEIEGQYIGMVAFSAEGRQMLTESYDALLAADISASSALRGRSLRTAYMTDFLQYLIDRKYPLTPIFIDGGWLEIDTPGDLTVAEALVRSGRLDGR